jgi:polyisoprenoid-binding protein YceI
MTLVQPDDSGAESISFFRAKPLRPTEFTTGRGLNTSSGREKKSVTAPRGNPPIRRSSSTTPVSTRSLGAGAWNRNALGKRVANRASTVARTAAESMEHLGGHRGRARQTRPMRRLRATCGSKFSPFVRYLNRILLPLGRVVKPYRMIRIMRHRLLIFLLLTCTLSLAQSTPIDTALSKITIHVDKTGVFSFAGDKHEIAAPLASGTVDEKAGAVEFTIDARKLQVLDPQLDEKKRAEVQKTMHSAAVLDSAKYQEIKFRSTAAAPAGANAWSVTGDLTLHGQTHPVTVQVKKEIRNGKAAYLGSTKLKQTDFGITPVAVAGGTVKVKDELKLDFEVITR